jgi:hypothetical protein
MKIISHRGNLNGPSPLENKPYHIRYCLSNNIECEIDVWSINDKFYLGHDYAMYPIDVDFLKLNGLWCHCKNLEALEKLLELNIHCFWHQNDDFTLTSKGFIWTYPNKNIRKNSIIVDNDLNWREKNYNCYAVCTDYLL